MFNITIMVKFDTTSTKYKNTSTKDPIVEKCSLFIDDPFTPKSDFLKIVKIYHPSGRFTFFGEF